MHPSVFNFLLVCSLTLLLSASNPAIAASKTDDESTGQTPYVAEVQRIYKELAAQKFRPSPPRMRPGVQSPPRPEVRYAISPHTRLSLPATVGKAEDMDLARNELAQLEKEKLDKSLAAVEPLVVLYAFSSGSDAAKYAERIVSILETAYASNPADPALQPAISLVLGFNNPRNTLPVEIAERILRTQLKILLSTRGLSNESIRALYSLALFLQSEQRMPEVLALYKTTNATLEAANSTVNSATRQMFRQQYIMLLRAAHKDDEVAAMTDEANAALAAMQAKQLNDADDALAKAEARAQIDPVALVKAQAEAATAHLRVNDDAAAARLFEKAISGYAEIKPINRDYQVDEAIWRYIALRLETAKVKDDEKVIWSYFGVLDSSYSQSHVSQVVGYYSQHHRNDDAIAFLEKLLDRQLKLHASLSQMQSTVNELLYMYRTTGTTDKAQAARDKLSAVYAEVLASETNATRLIEAAQIALHEKDSAAKALVTKSIAAIDADRKLTNTKLTAQDVARFAVAIANGGDVGTAVQVLRTAYEMKMPERDYGSLESAANEIVRVMINQHDYVRADELIAFALSKEARPWTSEILLLRYESLIAQAADARATGKGKGATGFLSKAEDAWRAFALWMSPAGQNDSLTRQRNELLRKYGIGEPAK